MSLISKLFNSYHGPWDASYGMRVGRAASAKASTAARMRPALERVASSGRTGYREATLHSEEMGARGYASRKALNPSRLSKLGSKAALAGGLVGAGMAGSYLIGKEGDAKRAYYGQREYDKRYNGAFDVAAGLATTAGIVAGGLSTLGVANVLKPSVWKARGKAKAVIKARSGGTSFMQDFTRSAQGLGHRPLRDKSSVVASAERRLKQNSLQPGLAGRLGLVAGVAGAGTVGFGMSFAQDPMGFIGSGVAMGALASAGIHKWSKGKYGAFAFIGRHPAAVGIGVGAAAAGGAFGAGRPAYATSEGNIISAEHESESVVSKMNYNTAGLTLALHNNRRAN